MDDNNQKNQSGLRACLQTVGVLGSFTDHIVFIKVLRISLKATSILHDLRLADSVSSIFMEFDFHKKYIVSSIIINRQ